jgi:hypothetical protein
VCNFFNKRVDLILSVFLTITCCFLVVVIGGDVYCRYTVGFVSCLGIIGLTVLLISMLKIFLRVLGWRVKMILFICIVMEEQYATCIVS